MINNFLDVVINNFLDVLCLLFMRFQVHLHLKHDLLKYKYLNVINLLVRYLANFENEVIIHCIQVFKCIHMKINLIKH